MKDLSVTPATVSECDSQRVYWHKHGTVYYLLLPGNFDTNRLFLHFDGPDSIEINGKTLHSGDECALPVDEIIPVRVGKKEIRLQVLKGTGIPAVFLTTASHSLKTIEARKTNKETGSILLFDENGSLITGQNLSSVKWRGNASFRFIKKNYQFKLEKGEDLFGMGKSKTWILTGNYRDKSHLRNRITFDLAAYAGLLYSPESRSVNLYINGEFRGLYLLSEKIQIGKNRVPITDLEKTTEEMNGGDLSKFKRIGSLRTPKQKKGKYYAIDQEPEDITGGYLVEMRENKTHYSEAVSAYFTQHKLTADFHSPEYLGERQYNYISVLLQSFENAIFARDGKDNSTGKHYSEIADTDSLVKKYMIEEISKNYDGNHSSQYFYKPADSESHLLFAGPVWDYDSAYGSYAKRKTFLTPEGFFINAETDGSSWWTALYEHEDFRDMVKKAWKSAFLPGLDILLGDGSDPTGRLRSLEDYASEIAPSAEMDFIRWPRTEKPGAVVQTGLTFRDNVTYLQNYIALRRDWLNTQWGE